jgi:hypothetical protein
VLSRIVAVLRLFRDDRSYCQPSRLIDAIKYVHLLTKMPQHYTLHRHGGRGYRVATEQASEESEDKATKSAEQITATARVAATFKLCREDGSMLLLVRLELSKLLDQFWCRELGQKNLTAVDIDRAVFASVVDLHDAVAEAANYFRLESHVHDV